MARMIAVDSTVRDAIEAAVREHMPRTGIDGVVAWLDDDWDGNPIIEVKVVLTGPGLPEGDDMLGVIGRVRSRLEQVDVDRFPMISFVLRKESGRFGFKPG